MKWTPMDDTVVIRICEEDLERDFASAKKVEKWRVGAYAFYQTAGLFPTKVLPLASIRLAYPHDFQIKGGCSCAGTYPSRGLVIAYGESGVLKLIPNREKEADHLIGLLKDQLPGLDTQIPDRYRKETREKY